MPKTTITRGKKAEENIEDDDEDFEDEVNETKLTDNAEKVPLFANADGRSKKSIAILKLYKMENQGWAYKGQIPLNSTQETIGLQYGDGMYMLEACNRFHKVMDTAENVRISLGMEGEKNKSSLNDALYSQFDKILQMAQAGSKESKELNEKFTELVLSITSQAQERERSFMAQVQKTNSDFMAGMLAMQQTGFQQTITLLTKGHDITMQQLVAINANKDDKTNSPKELLEVFMRGIELARDMNDGDEEDEEIPLWQEIAQGGLGLLTKVYNTRHGLPASTEPAQNPVDSKRELKKRKLLKEAIGLHRAVRSSGLTVSEALSRLEGSTERPSPNEPDEDESEESDEDDESDSDDFESEESAGAREPN